MNSRTLENKKEAFTLIAIGLLLIGILSSNQVFARDLGSAARSYTNTIKSIGQVMSVAGVIAGGVCMQIPGAAMFGKNVLVGGLIGGLCSFGAPAFAALLSSVFGGG